MVHFGFYLNRNATCWPERSAIISGEETLSYRQLNDQSNILANALKKLGLKRGERLALIMKSSTEWMLAWYACQKLGVAVMPLHVRLLSDELVRTIELAGCSALIYGAQYAAQARNIYENCGCVKHFIECGSAPAPRPEAVTSWDRLMSEGDVSEAQEDLRADEESVILFTSGTTGMSKGVVRTQQMVRDHALVLAVGNDGDNVPEIMLTPAPLYHTAGLFCIFKTAALGGTLVLVDGFDTEKICEQTERHGVTQILLLPPVSYQRLYQSEHVKKYRLDSVRLALVTAGKCTAECLDDIFSLFPNAKIRPSWGSTEVCSATGSNLTREDIAANPKLINTVGKINSLSQIRLVDEAGNDVPDGTPGEALVRSPLVLRGYLGDPESLVTRYTDGWYRSEDIMMKDADGYYYLMDRKRDIVKTGGENVYAQEVERVLQSHPAILDSAVVGVPDPRFGEAIAAAVVLREGAEFSVEEFVEFCRGRLASYKKPRYLAIMDKLPENNVGKVQKNTLRQNSAELFKRIC